MGRGKPFYQSVSHLARKGVIPRAPWMSAVEANPPQFEPVVRTRPPCLVYPEDRLREKFLQRNPAARRVPVDLKARTIPERHIADRFVSMQMRFMEEDNLAEEEAYEAADRMLCSEIVASQSSNADFFSSLIDRNVTDDQDKLYVASLRDSQRDQKLYRGFAKGDEEN